MYHESVLLKESVEYLSVKKDGLYVDATFGAGGHSRLIAENLKTGHVYGFDQDLDAINNFSGHSNITLIRSNFRFIKNFLRYYDALPVDGILADLGISSHHIEVPERGFSFRFDAPLDMRMNAQSKVSAWNVVNEYERDKIVKIFKKYGEIPQAERIVSAIEKERNDNKINTTFELASSVNKFSKPGRENSLLAQVFQAIRIEVNREMDALDEFLKQSYDCLKSGGRLVIISYHSLEDRMVKSFFREQAEGNDFNKTIMGQKNLLWKDISRGAITPSEDEIKNNPRSRSAKMRVGEKI
jgi:16S rRNA (cytosine1402-N4)-methyltransferase